MPSLLRFARLDSTQTKNMKSYIWYAIGEVLLIFAGITLALWFSNWNDERQLREVERSVLENIVVNLEANVSLLNRSIERDEIIVATCARLIESISRKDELQDSFKSDLDGCRWWTSPFLNYAAYESLNARGNELISDPVLRNAIVYLYDRTYSHLVNDTDKLSWNFQSAVIEPIVNRHLRRTAQNEFTPINYEALLEADEFLSMLYMKRSYQIDSIAVQNATREATIEVIGQIQTWLDKPQ